MSRILFAILFLNCISTVGIAVSTKDAMKILGLEGNVMDLTEKEILDANKAKIMAAHPDKEGGTAQEFQRVNDAYNRVIEQFRFFERVGRPGKNKNKMSDGEMIDRLTKKNRDHWDRNSIARKASILPSIALTGLAWPQLGEVDEVAVFRMVAAVPISIALSNLILAMHGDLEKNKPAEKRNLDPVTRGRIIGAAAGVATAACSIAFKMLGGF